jgi:hypothetical protein
VTDVFLDLLRSHFQACQLVCLKVCKHHETQEVTKTIHSTATE